MTTATTLMPSRLADTARQYPAAFVYPVLPPSTEGSRFSSRLRFGCSMSL